MTVGLRALLLGLAALVSACATTAPGDAHHVTVRETPAADPADEKFRDFLLDFRASALAQGISRSTYDRATANISRNARVEQLNREQPEFVTPIWTYMDHVVSDKRISGGVQKLADNAGALSNIESKYGVPREVLVAIWGAESDYGAAMGTFNLFEALATLAYDGPRTDYARREFIAALKMVDKNGYSPAQMTGSWAGAFGQTQFVPSSFLAHAVDGDGDGRIDIWNDPADALASSAVLLADAGWQRGNPCAYEVTLPPAFDYALADIQNAKAVADWSRLGVKTAAGGILSESNAQAAIYLPAGARGPAFLVFDNFKVVLKYNNAASYALAVCTLAARFTGSGIVAHAWPREEQPLQPDERIAFQSSLKALGFDPGTIDGVLGHGVRNALREYQKARGLDADAFPTHELLIRLMTEVATQKH